MDASCKIQGSIHVFRLVNNMCPGKWVHINPHSIQLSFYILYMPINLSHYSSSLLIDPIHSYWWYSYWKYNGYRPQPYVYNRYLV